MAENIFSHKGQEKAVTMRIGTFFALSLSEVFPFIINNLLRSRNKNRHNFIFNQNGPFFPWKEGPFLRFHHGAKPRSCSLSGTGPYFFREHKGISECQSSRGLQGQRGRTWRSRKLLILPCSGLLRFPPNDEMQSASITITKREKEE